MKKHIMFQLRLEGHTYADIAKQTNVSRQRVQQVLSPPKEIRDYVVRKYDGKCKNCGVLVGKSGHVHHTNKDSITGDTGAYRLMHPSNHPNTTYLVLEDFNDIENLELLCVSCHRMKHGLFNR